MRSFVIAVLAVTAVAGCRDQKTLGVFDAGADASRLPIIDGGPAADADLTPTGRIQEAKDAPDGLVDITIEEAVVTYIKPAVGEEGAGLFVQAKAEGPGLFVGVAANTLEPTPVPGDTIAFTITEMGSMNGGLRVALHIDDYSRVSTGVDLDEFVQDLTNASDLVSSLAGYDSELIELDATINGDFTFGGNDHLRAPISTVGVPDSDMLTLRVPATLVDLLSLTTGCSLHLWGVMWRFGGTAQPSGWVAGDISNVVCAAPKVVSAVAASQTSVIVTVDRPLAAMSVLGDGSQFTITPTLTTSAAAVDGNRITVTTSAQTEGVVYTVTVAATVTDSAGTGVDGSANSATFKGFASPAAIEINEVNANIAGGCDLVEVRALSAGAVGAFQLWARDQATFTFPEMTLDAGDLVVIHLGSATNCNLTGAIDETTSISSAPATSHPQNYDTAFDLYSNTGGLTATSNVLTLVSPAGVIVDAVLLHNDDNNVAGASEARAADVAAAGQWTTTGGTVPAGGFIDADFVAHGVPGLQSSGTDAAGTSIQRIDGSDDDDRSDWTAAPAASSWGVLNSGQ